MALMCALHVPDTVSMRYRRYAIYDVCHLKMVVVNDPIVRFTSNRCSCLIRGAKRAVIRTTLELRYR